MQNVWVDEATVSLQNFYFEAMNQFFGIKLRIKRSVDIVRDSARIKYKPMGFMIYL